MMNLRLVYVFGFTLICGSVKALEPFSSVLSLDELDQNEEARVARSPDAAVNPNATILAERQMVRALMSRNTLAQVVKRLQGISSPNVTTVQAELDKLIANQKQTGMDEVIQKLKERESNEDVEKMRVDVFLEDYGGPTRDAGKIAKQIVKIETVEAQLSKLPFNMGLEYLVAVLTNVKPLLMKYNLWDAITKAKEQLKVTTRAG